MIHEVIAFDAAVAKAYEFYLQHPDETLIIVTADHETASLFTGFHYSLSPGLLKHQKISLQEFTRKLENTKTVSSKISFDEVMQLIKADFGLGDSTRGLALSQMELQQLRAAYEREFVQNKAINPDANYMSISEEKTLAELCVSILNTRAGLGWGTQDHSAMPVPIRVIGNGQNRFCQQIDNTDVPKIIGELMGF
jgi:alkaline phosphatase